MPALDFDHLPASLLGAIYDILVEECGASKTPHWRDEFIDQLGKPGWTEYSVPGGAGIFDWAARVYNRHGFAGMPVSVDPMPEHVGNPAKRAAAARAQARLESLMATPGQPWVKDGRR